MPCYKPYPDPDDTSLGAALKRRRLDLDLSQRQVADILGVGKDSYQTYEWNEFTPHLKVRKKIGEFLGFNWWDDGTNSLKNLCQLYRNEHGLSMHKMAVRIGIDDGVLERINVGKSIGEVYRQKISNFLRENFSETRGAFV